MHKLPAEPSTIITDCQKQAMPNDTLGEKLRIVIDRLPSTGVTLNEIIALVGQDGLLILAVLLTLVFMVPVSIPGVSTIFGFAILLIGISRLLNRNLWLPKRITQRVLPADKIRAGLMQGSIWLHRLERVSRPHRLHRLTSVGMMATWNNCALILGAILLMAPFGLIPFSNTLPALALLFLAIGLIQHDGLCILFGHLANIVTIIYFTILLVGGGAIILEALRHIIGKGA